MQVHACTFPYLDYIISLVYLVCSTYLRGVGTGPAGPATARPMFPESTIKNIIPLFVIQTFQLTRIEGFSPDHTLEINITRTKPNLCLL